MGQFLLLARLIPAPCHPQSAPRLWLEGAPERTWCAVIQSVHEFFVVLCC